MLQREIKGFTMNRKKLTTPRLWKPHQGTMKVDGAILTILLQRFIRGRNERPVRTTPTTSHTSAPPLDRQTLSLCFPLTRRPPTSHYSSGRLISLLWGVNVGFLTVLGVCWCFVVNPVWASDRPWLLNLWWDAGFLCSSRLTAKCYEIRYNGIFPLFGLSNPECKNSDPVICSC